ncbi:hypothetical protein FB45DRAFT_736799 [Roridomyces roridus]|uniref:GATA-type domain-containing protein n=1 Tax=Roridomyces roridus TaxID=1738132 RepID=A0AAD7FZ48_9AGAR|nr:hypothetical protein FB45DRAFT_736799 [Roridomyces roridus]
MAQPNHPGSGSAPPYPPSGPPAHTNAGASHPKQCHHCKTLTTPLWRRDPTNQQPLCNACGLYLQQRHAYRPADLIQAEREGAGNGPGPTPECNHCHTQETSVWRRDKEGNQVCNACGVYQRLRGVPRPAGLMQGQGKPKTRAKYSQA